MVGSKMRKRKNQAKDDEPEPEVEREDEQNMDTTDHSDDEESSDDAADASTPEGDEEVDGEEDSDDEDDEEEENEPTGRANNEDPFMDSFYGLASMDPKERSQSAQVMLHRCLFGPDANSKDAAYAFRRLLNGVCSGRAAARQGNASALASFLKIAFKLDKMEGVRAESKSNAESEDQSMLAYVRTRLMDTTDSSKIAGKMKGSEERDYQFGRLFGTLAIVRSGILTNFESNDENNRDSADLIVSLTNDLADLFWEKRWMREPAGHAIITLLLSVLKESKHEKGQKVFAQLIEKIIIPRLLAVDGKGKAVDNSEDMSSLLKVYCAEQIAVALAIQAYSTGNIKSLQYPLNEPILSTSNMSKLAPALRATSVVVQPRTHLVWETIWAFFAKNLASDEGSQKSSDSGAWSLRVKLPIGDESPKEVLASLVQVVIGEALLGVESAEQGAKATHGRRALAMCLIRNLCGVPFYSSIVGPMTVLLNGDILENTVLKPDLVRILFLDVINAGHSKKDAHMLKPMAISTLQSISQSMPAQTSEAAERRLACARAILHCDVRFDAKTKTSFVSDVLGFNHGVKQNIPSEQIKLWKDYVTYLQQEVLKQAKSLESGDATANITGHVELLYAAAKSILRLQGKSDSTDLDAICQQIEMFFLASAFFDCSTLATKKKKRKSGPDDPAVQAAQSIKAASEKGPCFPYDVRSLISARFFSLLSEHVHHAIYTAAAADVASSDSPTSKNEKMYSILCSIINSCKALETSGATRFSIPAKDAVESDDEDEDDEPLMSSDDLIAAFQKMVKEVSATTSDDDASSMVEAKRRFATGVANLALSLHLHQLHCGSSDEMMRDDDPDAGDDDDDAEIRGAMSDLKAISELFISLGPDEIDEDADNPLLGLVESCANILSSPLSAGTSSKGSSPKLLREAIKFSWLGGLSLSQQLASKDHTFFDLNVVGTLLDAIGAPPMEGMAVGDEDEDDDDEMDVDESDKDGSDSDGSGEGVFSKASNLLEDDGDDEEAAADDDDDDENKKSVEAKKDDDDGNKSDADVELDSSNLKTMLEDDSDADVDIVELEHHEGADAALAKLIKLKQDMRKAAGQAREKLEISNQLRCTLLLELAMGRPDGAGDLFRSDIILKLLVPMLSHRRNTERSQTKLTEKGVPIGAGERQALLERLTSLIKTKLCKMKLSSMSCSQPEAYQEEAKSVVSRLIESAKKSESKDYTSCCSSGLVMVLRSMSSADEAIVVAEALKEALHEWSEKRTSKLGVSLFDEIIRKNPGVAAVVLLPPLLKSCQDARSPFLKMESYGLLTEILSKKYAEDDPDYAIAKQALAKVRSDTVAAFASTLSDAEMTKTKRVRPVLKALDKFIVSIVAPFDNDGDDLLTPVKKLLTNLVSSDSQAVKNAAQKAMDGIEIKEAEIATARPKVQTTPKSNKKGPGKKGSSGKKKKGKKR